MKNVIIVGANGFLGSNMVKKLITYNTNIFAVVHNNAGNISSITAPNLQIIYNFNELYDYNVDYYDALYYFAWSGNSGDFRSDITIQQRNVLDVCDVLKKAKDIKCKKFIFAGSIMEYEAVSTIIIDDLHPGMGNIYSASKLVADAYLKTIAAKYNIQYISLLISNIYGPGERNPRLVNSTIRKILRGEKTEFSTETQLYDFIYLDDAIDKFIVIGEKAEFGTYYIGNPEQRQLKDFLLVIGEICGREECQLGIGLLGDTSQVIDYKLINTYRFEDQFGCGNKITFEEGIMKTKKHIEMEMYG